MFVTIVALGTPVDVTMDTFTAAIATGATINTLTNDNTDTSLNMSETPSNTSTSSHWSEFYLNKVHGPLLLTFGLLGVVFCVVNIIVLTRRRMRTPMNFVLTVIAVIDLLEFYSHSAYAAYWHIDESKPYRCHSEVMAKVTAIGSQGRRTAHGVNLWLTVALAVTQYICVCRKDMRTNVLTHRRARVITVCVVLACIAICVPDYVSLKAVTVPPEITVSQADVSNLNVTECYMAGDLSGTSAKTVVYEVVLNTSPSLILMVLTLVLVVNVKIADRRRQRMLENINNSRTREIRNTTLMLAALILSTIVLEAMPSVLLIIANFKAHIKSSTSSETVKDELKFVTSPKLKAYIESFTPALVLMPVVSSIVNFIIYCVMSRQFRKTFIDIIRYRTCSPASDIRRASEATLTRSVYVNSPRNIARADQI